MATRRSQPFRQGPRVPGVALDAMKRGRSASGSNPQDAVRAFMSAAHGRRGGLLAARAAVGTVLTRYREKLAEQQGKHERDEPLALAADRG
jgi:hypothetical protein